VSCGQNRIKDKSQARPEWAEHLMERRCVVRPRTTDGRAKELLSPNRSARELMVPEVETRRLLTLDSKALSSEDF